MSTPSNTRLDVKPTPGGLPLLLAETNGDLPSWVTANRDSLRAAATEHGAVLVRGLGLNDRAYVAALFQYLATDLVADREAFAPRPTHPEGVYSSTKWPANQQMCMHNELSYTLQFPGLMLFACLTAPVNGGATAVADATAVLRALPTELVERFTREGWILNRTYNEEIGASVAEVFGADDRETVEAYCRANHIDFQWQSDGGLRTQQRRHAVLRHPKTGELCWFNQIGFLNEWTMEPEVHEFLVELYGPDGLPFNTRFGNGDPIGRDVVQLLNDVYDTHTVREPWQDGDLMLVDNIRTAHSREAYDGPRDVLVAMADAVNLADCSPTKETPGQ